jgi:hypothetical protein
MNRQRHDTHQMLVAELRTGQQEPLNFLLTQETRPPSERLP